MTSGRAEFFKKDKAFGNDWATPQYESDGGNEIGKSTDSLLIIILT
jgi:hypothetical protein